MFPWYIPLVTDACENSFYEMHGLIWIFKNMGHIMPITSHNIFNI